MFGRKFLFLKKKIYEIEQDTMFLDKNEGVLLKDNNFEDGSFSMNNQLSNSQNLQIFSFGDKNLVNHSVNKNSEDLSQSLQKMDGGASLFNHSYHRHSPNRMERIFGENIEQMNSKKDIDKNLILKTEVGMNYFANVNYEELKLTKFKFSFENEKNKIESVINKRILNNQEDLERLINSKKLKVNKSNRIYFNERFFIFPSTISMKKYYKIKLANKTNKLITLSAINYDNVINKGHIKKNMNEISRLETFSFIIDVNSNMNETYNKMREFKENNKTIEKQIENFQQLFYKQETETILLEERKALDYGEMHRKKLHEYIHNIRGNIRVYCRVKPCPTQEECIIRYPELPSDPLLTRGGDVPLYNVEIKNNKNNETSIFNFDKVFSEKSSQSEIFLEVKPFIQSALDGENICIFAYGSTGSGKTFTMQGSYNNNPKDNSELINANSGVLPRCAEFIFEETNRLSLLGRKFKIFFSAMEIYNENLYDLLAKYNSANFKKDKNNNSSNNNHSRQPLTIYSSNNDIQIKNLIWVAIENKEDILKLTKDASDSRRCDSTQFNSTSSRSHAIFQIKIDAFKEDASVETSIINIIDLAGSERSSLQNLAAKTKEEIEAVKRIQNEANFINKSLTTLGRIISMIGDKKLAKISIPYRESKLTLVLQNSLKPNSKTVMIVTVCSDLNNFNMTKESLKFATNAMISC